MSYTSAVSGVDLNSSLEAGLQQVGQTPLDVVFTKYIRYVLPLDGYVFWLRVEAATFQGSIHYGTITTQNETESTAVSRVVFTTSQDIGHLLESSPQTTWIGEHGGRKFAFSSQGFYSPNAKLFHYEGNAVYPYMESQLVDLGAQLDPSTLIVNNSLPAWLAIKEYNPIWLVPPNPGIELFPSFLVPPNLVPPYGVVHIGPETTKGLQMAPLLEQNATHHLLATEVAKITLYGLTNRQAADWFDTVMRYSQDTNAIGMMSTPAALRDEKQIQNELNVLAMKKSIEFEIAYDQQTIRDLALQLIQKVSATVVPQDFVP